MNQTDKSLPELSALLDRRLAVVGRLAVSLEASRLALLRNDAESIARGAAHQAELCRQWALLEEQLRGNAACQRKQTASATSGSSSEFESLDFERSAQIDAEWQALRRRIGYLTRVHSSLLRHMQRSLGILQRVVDSCAPTYVISAGAVESRLPTRVGD